jgi:enoyl-[acyl-carrier protein] reductase I
MGPTKAALESIVRYLARDLGPRHVRVNAVAAGPLETVAARSIPGFNALKASWTRQAPLGWDPADADPVADAVVFLLSDMARAITGEVLHVDGGFFSQGAPPGLGSGEAEG